MYNLKKTIFLFFLLFLTQNLYSYINILEPAPNTQYYYLENVLIRWEMDSDLPVDLYLSKDDGNSWELIATNISPSGNGPYIGEFTYTIPEMSEFNLNFKVELTLETRFRLIGEIENAHNDWIRSVEFSKDGTELLSGSRNNQVKVWEINTLDQKINVELGLQGSSTYDVKYLHTNDTVMICNTFATVGWLRNSGDVEEEYVSRIEDDNIRAMDVNVLGDVFAIGTNNGLIQIWAFDRIEGGVFLMQEFNMGLGAVIYDIAFSPDGKTLAFSTFDRIYTLEWQLISSQIPIELGYHGSEDNPSQVWTLDFSPDGSKLASGSIDGYFKVWDIETRQELISHNGHRSQIRAVHFSNDGNYLFTGSLDATLKRWDIANFDANFIEADHGEQILTMDISPSGDTIATAGRSTNYIRLWKLESSLTESDSTDINIKYLGYASIGDVEGMEGEEVDIQINFRHDYTLQFLENSEYEAELVINYPYSILHILQDSQVEINDTYYWSKFESDFKSELMTTIRAEILNNGLESGSIKQETFVIVENNVFDIIWEGTGSVRSTNYCIGEEGFDIEFASTGLSINISPLPASEVLNVNIFNPVDEKPVIKIFDTNGGLVLDYENQFNNAGKYNFTIELTDFASGVYYILYQVGNFQVSKTIIVSK